jgi:DNA-binding beta-propeller fold protein YncE
VGECSGTGEHSEVTAASPISKRQRAAVVLLLAALAVLVTAATALAATGQLTQLAGTAGCVSDTGSTPNGDVCIDGKALAGATSAALSPDGKNLYVTSFSGVAVFERNTMTGALTQLPGIAGCVSESGSTARGDACADGKALVIPQDVSVSPDGKNVYVAWTYAGEGGVAVFQRDTTTGVLIQLEGTAGCVSETGSTPSGDACADGKALIGASSVVVSADGKNAYVAAGDRCCASGVSHAVAVFERNSTTGQLTQLAGTDGCVSEDGTGGACANGRALLDAHSAAVSADGKNVYVASRDAVAAFARDATTGALTQLAGAAGCVSETGAGACADGKALADADSVAVTAGGRSVYVAAGDTSAVSAFRRNATTGALTQLVGPTGKAGCVSNDGSRGACADGKALAEAIAVTVSGDGKSVYVAASVSSAVAVFARNLTSGLLTQLAGTAGCVSNGGVGGGCTNDRALSRPTSVKVSADGKSVYITSGRPPVPGPFSPGAVAIFAREGT